MLRLIVLSMIAALSGNPKGLERVCDELDARAPLANTIADAFSAVQKPPACNAYRGRGVCQFGQTHLSAGYGGAASLTPVQPTDPTADTFPTFVFTAFDTNSGEDLRAADIYVNDKPLALGLPAGEPIEIEASLRGGPGKWTHVLVTHSAGKTYTLELPFQGNVTKGEAPTTASLRGGPSQASWGVDDVPIWVLGMAIPRGGETFADNLSVEVPFYTVTVE